MLGPLALIVVIIAALIIINSSMGGDEEEPASQATQTSSESKDGPETPKEYVVESGDSLTSIALKFEVSVQRLERLNPDINAQTLNEGTTLTLR